MQLLFLMELVLDKVGITYKITRARQRGRFFNLNFIYKSMVGNLVASNGAPFVINTPQASQELNIKIIMTMSICLQRK